MAGNAVATKLTGHGDVITTDSVIGALFWMKTVSNHVCAASRAISGSPYTTPCPQDCIVKNPLFDEETVLKICGISAGTTISVNDSYAMHDTTVSGIPTHQGHTDLCFNFCEMFLYR